MLQSIVAKIRQACLSGARWACILAGTALVAVALSSFVLPLLVGLGLLVLAGRLADQPAEEHRPALMPIPVN